ncbi:MAG TPA: tetratricopeptide repeat protein, partial [Chloroflexota bacterium]
EAVRLFIERARAVRPEFELTNENGAAVAEICTRLDGLPLALELAAARLRLFPPQALLRRLSQSLQLLTGGAHDLPIRHQTLRGAIDWSYGLLSDEEKGLFARLAVFRGGCTLEAIAAVSDSDGDLGGEVLDGVASLVEKSLLRQDSSRVPELEGAPRFVMLETIRAYAAERLEESDAAEEILGNHARYYLSLAEETASRIDGEEQRAWFNRLEVERDNLRVALQWARENGDVDVGLRLAIALQGFWMVRGPLSRGRRWLEGFAAGDKGSRALQAAALSAAGRLAAAEGRRRESTELIERSLVLYRELGDRRGAAEAVGWLPMSWHMLGEAERAADLLRQGELEGRETGDQALLALSLRFQAALAAEQGDPQRTQQLGEESLALYRGLDDSEGRADVLRILAAAAYGAGERERARALTDDLLALLLQSPLDPQTEEWLEPLAYRARMLGDYMYATRILDALETRAQAAGDRRITAHARAGLGLLAREQGDYGRAAVLYNESAAVLQEVGDLLGRCRALIGLSDVARDQGDAERVIELCEESLSVLREIGDTLLTAFALHSLGLAAWYQGDRDRAEHLLAESLSALQSHKKNVDAAEVHTSIGLLALDTGQYDRAASIFTECLVVARSTESRWIMGTLLEGMAGVAAGTRHAERAAWLFGAAEALRRTMGTPRWPALESLYDRSVAAAATALGQERFLHALERGRAMALDQAVSFALQEVAVP